jgi:microcompartment protein CcmL/EutN
MANSIGIIETEGLVAAIEAADAAVKAANVKLVGYEQAKGRGLTAVKVEGDVGAVKAAVEAGSAAAAQIIGADKVFTLVIPRPATDLDMMVGNRDTVGYSHVSKKAAPTEPKSAPSQPTPKKSPKKSLKK